MKVLEEKKFGPVEEGDTNCCNGQVIIEEPVEML